MQVETAHANDYAFMDGIQDAVHAVKQDNGEDDAEYDVKVLRDDVRKGDFRGQRLSAELGTTRFIYWKADSGASDPKQNDLLTVDDGSDSEWLIRDVAAIRLGSSFALECAKAPQDG